LHWVLHNVLGVCNGCDMHNGELLTAKEKAAELGISRSTLSRKVASGAIIPAYKDESNEHNGVQLFDPEPVSA
jgi:hypothetical protein